MELDDAYANAAYIPDADGFLARWPQEAADFRGHMDAEGRARLGLIYGPSPRQALDLFLPQDDPEGLLIFVHGGYWLRFDRSFWSHFAQGALARGWAVAMPSYDLCPVVRISDITRQVARAVTLAADMVAGPIRLAGHSAGGHLVARMLAKAMVPKHVSHRFAHVMPISPLSDLRPFLRTSMNADLRLDEVEAIAESPMMQHVPDIPVTVWVGAEERPVFLDQAQWLVKRWNCGHHVAPGRHHFDVIDPLRDPDSGMIATLLDT
ncbi:alpha/beta hydrolase [Thalassococcus sp. CAU 1522]|uniref:Alpha/beta hydrolase n=1 Tax=Thalassococcus arenae TaxID=2851652 RepID=A0ABS6N7R1_9RHOB|nr:alpha/beta hydrolase [Thalassococcus arenae]MBV2359580.1 alpha/beta hydrolase [Thalassococcus arenae]